MNTTTYPARGAAAAEVPKAKRMPLSLRGAQLLFALPLGAVQFVASFAFSISLGWDGPRDALVAIWCLLMAPCGVAIAWLMRRPRLAQLRAALGLLVAQAAFSTVKLAVYHESASFVFFAFIALAAGLLVLPPSRRYFAG